MGYFDIIAAHDIILMLLVLMILKQVWQIIFLGMLDGLPESIHCQVIHLFFVEKRHRVLREKIFQRAYHSIFAVEKLAIILECRSLNGECYVLAACLQACMLCSHLICLSALLAELSFLAAALLHATVVVNNFDALSFGSGARMSLWWQMQAYRTA